MGGPLIMKTLKCEERGQVHVSSQGGESPYALTIDTLDHSLMADEPKDMGGTNTGPGPFELLLSSLGACMTMTLHMYAKHKGIELPEFEVLLCEEHDRDKEGKTTTNIQVQLVVDDSADQDMIDKMIEIMHKCPVHRTLNGEINTDIKLAD